MLSHKSKNFNFPLILTLTLCLLLLAGCDDDPTEPIEVPENGSIVMTLDGTVINLNKNAVGGVIGPLDNRAIYGETDGSDIFIEISVPTAPGTYDLISDSGTLISVKYNDVIWSSESGSITLLTSTDTKATGTFFAVLIDEQQNHMTITDGSFDVPVYLPTE